ncbi:MAG TPA: hypothetical protein PLA48_09520 [Holophaga sp.]|nr:hypothetical protein [Holophaga sp.]
MSVKPWIFSTMAALILCIGCGNKPSEPLLASAPPPAREPREILENLQYLGTRKDLKQIPVISLTDTNITYALACRLHRHAGGMGLVLTDQEIMDLGVTDLRTKGYLVPGVSRMDYLEAKRKAASRGKALPWMAKVDVEKLDTLPTKDTLPDGKPDPDYQEMRDRYATPAMAAGIFRVVSGVPEAVWPRVAVLETRPDPRSPDVQGVVLGFKGTPVLRVAVMKNKADNYGLYDLVLEQSTKRLMTLMDGSK